MSKIKELNPTNYPDWDDWILSADNYSFFHTSAWAKVLADSYNYRLLYFTIIDNTRLLGLIPLMEIKSIFTGFRAVSLPFTDYCTIIAKSIERAQKLFETVVNYGNKVGWKSIELRDSQNFFYSQVPFSTFISYILDLTKDQNDIFKSFRDSTRRNIEKAERENVKVIRSNSLESVKEFYRLNCMTRKHHGLPPQPWFFFKNVFKHIISLKKGSVILASYQGKVVAGAVFFHFGREAIYKYGASDRNYLHLRPNNLVMWKAIKWCSRNGFTEFSFGRTETENDGLLQFKRGWAGKEETINYYKYDLKKKCFVTPKAELKTFYNYFKHMPSPLLRLAGNLLYRHVG